jgi:pimeloyl-ACP methyl ester carboxylesterase
VHTITEHDEEAARSRHLVVDCLRLHLLDWGGSGPPVVLVHGGGLNAHSWDRVCARLRALVRCFAPDQRGHGLSEWSPALEYRIDDHRRDLAALLEALGITDAVVVGMSLGGHAALAHAVTSDASISGLVVVDVAPWVQRDGAIRIRRSIEATEFESIDDGVVQLTQAHPERPPDAIRRALERNLMRLPSGRLTWRHDSRHRTAEQLESIIDEAARIGDSLHLIRCPTLVVFGERSEIISPEIARRTADGITDSRVVMIPGASHNVQRDRPSELADAIAGFLADIGYAS